MGNEPMQALTQALAAAAVLLALSTPATAAKLYKCVDENGNVSYSQTEQPCAKAEEVKVPSGPLTDEQLDQLGDQSEEDRENREFEQSHATAVRDRKERMRENCKVARENLRILKTDSRIQGTGADGEQFFLDEEAIQKKLQDTEEQIQEYCGS